MMRRWVCVSKAAKTVLPMVERMSQAPGVMTDFSLCRMGTTTVPSTLSQCSFTWGSWTLVLPLKYRSNTGVCALCVCVIVRVC